MRAQVRQVLSNIQTVLAGLGGRMSDVISLTHYTTDIAAFMQSGDIRQAFFSAPYPVTTTIQVAALYDPALLMAQDAAAGEGALRLRFDFVLSGSRDAA